MSYKYADKKWSEMTAEEREKAGSKSAHKTAKERAQAHQAARGANIDKPEADGTGGLYTDKKWSELTKDQREEIKVIHAQGPDGNFKGAKDSFQDQRAKSMGYDSEQSKKDDWEQKRNNSSSENESSTQSNQTSSSPRISSLMEGYSTDRKYTGPDGGTYTAKEADDAGWTAGYYDEGGGAYVPQKKTFDNPHSAEAIAYRQQYKRDTSKDGKYAEGMKYVSKDDPRRMYDPSANVGYGQDLTPGQELKQWHMSRAYRQEMQNQGIDWKGAGGYSNYNFDMTKGYFVPNQSLRQQRASMYDNMYMREADRGKLGDRNSYIHKYFDPLGGNFEYNPNYDLNLG